VLIKVHKVKVAIGKLFLTMYISQRKQTYYEGIVLS